MTERRVHQLQRNANTLSMGPSQLHWDGNALNFSIDEVTCPLPRHVRGSVKFHPAALPQRRFQLDQHGQHHWTPIAPDGRVEVALDHPDLRWSGSGYFDANTGQSPLESAFSGWNWSRTTLQDSTLVCYDANRRDADALSLALNFDRSGNVQEVAAPPLRKLGASRWGIDRHTHADPQTPAQITETLLDAPFYARSLVSSTLWGQRATTVHESLSLDRFRTRWVQSLLRFRIPRPPASFV
jgi:carotenoid 1,2-hydratase